MILLDNAGVLYLHRSFAYFRHLSKYDMYIVDICISSSVNVISKDKNLTQQYFVTAVSRR